MKRSATLLFLACIVLVGVIMRGIEPAWLNLVLVLCLCSSDE